MSNLWNNTTLVCNELVTTEYNGIISAICAVFCLFGLVYTFFGYRCFKAVMFLSGLIFGGTTVFLMCREERIFQQQVSMEVGAGIAAGIGILCGFITMLIRYVGLFLQGFFLGTLLAIGAILALQSFYNPSTAWIPVGILFGTGVLFALLTLKFQKGCIILSTAVLGSALITVCIDYFIEQFILLRFIWEALMAAGSIQVCWYTWLILAVWPSLSFAGALLQWRVTGKGYDHTDVIIMNRRRKQVRTHLVRERPASTRRTSEPRAARATRQSRAPRESHAPTQRSTRDQRTSRQPEPRHPPISHIEDEIVEEIPPPSGDMPPSYFECVELGVGEPVSSQHQVVRTEHGSYVTRDQNRGRGNIRGELIQGVQTGAGYSVAPASGGYVENAQSRHNQRQSGRRSDPDHQRIEQFSSNANSSSQPQAEAQRSRHRGRKRGSDMQSLIDQPRSNRDAVAEHARRVMEAQSRRTRQTAGDVAGTQPGSSAPPRG
nr:transmembrane protein 198 [Ciona intestinalis]|eukprot:XP_018670671.2 transmembrane protein 198 [Ciona intestinalis]